MEFSGHRSQKMRSRSLQAIRKTRKKGVRDKRIEEKRLRLAKLQVQLRAGPNSFKRPRNKFQGVAPQLPNRDEERIDRVVVVQGPLAAAGSPFLLLAWLGWHSTVHSGTICGHNPLGPKLIVFCLDLSNFIQFQNRIGRSLHPEPRVSLVLPPRSQTT